MFTGRVLIGTFTAGFLWCFMPSFSKGLVGSHMWSDMTGYYVVSEQLIIILSCIYALRLDVTGQYKYCYIS